MTRDPKSNFDIVNGCVIRIIGAAAHSTLPPVSAWPTATVKGQAARMMPIDDESTMTMMTAAIVTLARQMKLTPEQLTERILRHRSLLDTPMSLPAMSQVYQAGMEFAGALCAMDHKDTTGEQAAATVVAGVTPDINPNAN